MTNKVKITMKNVPEGLDSMYLKIEETAISQGVRNVLFSGVKPVNGNVVEIDIGNAGTVGAGVIFSADNFTTSGQPFKAMRGYGVIEAGADSTLSFDNIVFLGSSTSDRAFNSVEALTDMQNILQEHGLPYINLIAETRSGSSAPYQAATLMPQAVNNNSSLENVLFFGQSPTNSLTQAFSTETQEVKNSLKADVESILNQANSAGWTPLYSNFNKTPEAELYEISQWNDSFLTPIVTEFAPQSISDGVYVQDYEKLGGLSNYLFSSRDGVHLAEISGDRLYRQYSAANIARFMGYDTRKSLSGRRVVVQPSSSTSESWPRIQNITPLPLGLNSAPYRHIGANLVDADTGELLTDLYVVVHGSRGINSGTGNAGDSSSSYLNDEVLKKCAWIGVDEVDGFYLEIGSFSQQLPDLASLILAGNRSSTGSDRVGEWVCNGETKFLDGVLRPCGVAEFLNVPAVDNKITATGFLANGSLYSYLSVIEMKFA
ncbi:hypothetical protein ACNSN2_07020 [Pseudoalteromonas sp. US3C1013]|uniref:hypothetical protein n=1 Tax=unclassified Pseudoalteromonas TaxID=194690 RepID=UPI003AB8A138